MTARATAQPSAACKVVSRVLASMRIEHECHVLSADCHLLADILLPESGVALLIEGPECYVRNTGRRRGALQLCCAQPNPRQFS